MRPAVRGFTLIEAMIVVGIIGILAGLSIGMGGSWRERQNFNEVAREVYNAVNAARGDSRIRGVPVVVTFSPQQVQAFRDTNGNHVFDSSETMIYLYPPVGSTFPKNVTLSSTTLSKIGVNPTTEFDTRGFAVDPANGSSFKGGSVVVTDVVLSQSTTVEFTLAGAVRISR